MYKFIVGLLFSSLLLTGKPVEPKVMRGSDSRHHGRARISYLDDNRIDIMEEIAKGQGEHLTTLLTMMNISNDNKKLEAIQKNFQELAYLSHGDFLDRLEEI